MSSSSARSFSSESFDHRPFSSRYFLIRSIGSRFAHASTSSFDRYRVGSSLEEWGPIRYVTASIIVGPPPLRALSAAAFVTAYTASRSLPTTRTPSKPYAKAFWARVFEAVWRVTGTEIAHWLFLQKKIVGVLKTPAKFIPAWKSPSLVAPSPKYVSVTTSSFRIFAAQAAPTAWGICVPTGLETGT